MRKANLERFPASKMSVQKLTLTSLVSPQSWTLLNELGMTDNTWLRKPPSTWASYETYQVLKHFVRNLRVTNDCAERGVALISDYIQIVTKNQDQRQHLLQGVESHRKIFPNATKSTLL